MSDNRSGYSGGVLRYPVSVVDHKKTLIDPQLQEIQEVIPEEATPENQLADKQYVNQGISISSATFRGTSDSGLTEEQFIAWADSLTKDLNDYCYWLTTDTSGKTIYKRYKYNGTTWAYEFDVAVPSSIPTALSELTEDTTHRVVTDTEKAAWNGITTSIKSVLAGDDFVDLGLPSGTLWAKFNIGATKPEESGLYFSWGNVEGHAEGSGYDFSQTNYNASAGATLTGNIPVGIVFDIARKNYGIPCKMPLSTHYQELIDNCTSEHTTINGVAGLLFTSNNNGNTIFLPKCGVWKDTSIRDTGSSGNYWTASYNSSTQSSSMSFNSSDIFPSYTANRYYGFCVRAII